MVGGFRPNNQATSWPNLHAQDKLKFRVGPECGNIVDIIKHFDFLILWEKYVVLKMPKYQDQTQHPSCQNSSARSLLKHQLTHQNMYTKVLKK